MRRVVLPLGAILFAAGLALSALCIHAACVGNNWIVWDAGNPLARLALSAVLSVLLLSMGVCLIRFHFRSGA